MFRTITLIVTLALPLLVRPDVAAAQPAFDVMRGLPSGPNVNIEAVVLIKDVHRFNAISDKVRERLERFPPVKEYLSPAVQKQVVGFDIYTEAKRLAQLMAPSGKNASAALVMFTNEGNIGGQFIMKAEAGFMDRLNKELSGPNPPPWKASVDGDTVTLPIYEQISVTGKLDGEWLRLGPDESMLIGQDGPVPELYSQTLAPYLERNDLAILLRPGLGLQMLSGEIDDPMAASALQGLKGILLGVEYNDWKTNGVRLVIEADALKQFAPMARRSDLENWFVPMVDSHTTSLFAISLPPALIGAGAELARGTPVGELEGGNDLVSLLSQFDGRLGYVGFDTPGDWALAMRFNTPEAAAAFAPALQKVLDGVVKMVGLSGQDFALLEEFPGAGKVLHFKPDEFLDGIRIAAIGANVVTVPRKGRLERLAALNSGGKKNKKVASLLGGPLTDGVKGVLEQPALALGYLLMSGDGALAEMFIVPSKAISIGVDAALSAFGETSGPEAMVLDLYTAGLKRLPLTFAVGMIGWLTAYDFALAVDVRDEILVFEIFGSQL
ncbi:MAG: hypothetical protein AAF654_08885 [Myxococcota bacterium]